MERHPIPWALYAFTQFLIVLSITVSSTNTSLCVRWLLFFPIARISYYLICYTTTGDVVNDQGLGSLMLTQLIVVIDYTLISDLQRDIYLRSQPPGVKEASPLTRFRRALSLYTSPRGVGWSFEPWSLPKPSSKSRFGFILSRVARALGYTLLNAFTSMVVNSHPALLRNTGSSVRDRGWFYHTTGVFAWALGAFAGLDMIHCTLAAFCVGLGISSPRDWPDFFGSPFDAYTVRRLWGRTWHQLLRRPLTSCAIFLVTNVFHCPIDGPYTPFVFVNTVFLISGLVHAGGDYMMLGRVGTGAFQFFALQGLAISLETIVSKVWNPPGSGLAPPWSPSAPKNAAASKSPPPLWTRIIGYIWVVSWFWWSLPFIVDAGIPAGVYGPHRGLSFPIIRAGSEHLYQLFVGV